MARGFALTLDATLAVIVLMLFVSVYSFLSSQAMEDPHVPLVLEKEANDLLIVLDKQELLPSMDEALLGEALNETLPGHVKWNMEMEYYNYTDGFVLSGNSTFGSERPEESRESVAQREFMVIENASVVHYAIARLRLWVE
ncbi:hypothetical protein JW721_04730 [Candidatus Micrarchaeota archaeon]|nr:hypothetical protein [Candidatus Micrarchaeota archaeon]